MARTGWLKLWRQMQDNPIWTETPFSAGQAWIDLLIRANFSETRIPKPGKTSNLMLGPGEAIVSLRELELNWGWSRNRVLRFFARLKRERMIGTTNETTFTRLKVLNWKKYQGEDEEGGTTSGTRGGTTSGTTSRATTEPPSEPPAEPPSEPIRRIQEQQQQKEEESPVYSTSSVAPKQGEEGDGSGAVVAVQKGPGDEKAQEIPTERLQKQVSSRLATPILEALGIPTPIAEQLSKAAPALRIYDVAEMAKTKTNPGGWARQAIEQEWTVPQANGEGLAKLSAALSAEISAKEQAWGRMGGMQRRAPDFPKRIDGEGLESYTARVNEWMKSKKSEGQK